MNMINRIFPIALSLVAVFFMACEDDVVKKDFDGDTSYGLSTVATFDAAEVGANYVVFEGTNSAGDASDAVLVVSTSENLAGANSYALTDDEDFSIRVSGLVPATMYYYSVVEADSLRVKGVGTVKSVTTEEGVIAFSLDYASTSAAGWAEVGFTTIDKDGDENTWTLKPYPADDSPTRAYRSASWAGAALTPENYLVFPKIDFKGVDGSFSFQIVAASSYYAEAIRVVASSEPITEENCQDAEVLFTHTLESTAVYYGNVDIPASYEGKPIYLAIVHTDVSDQEALFFLGATFIYK